MTMLPAAIRTTSRLAAAPRVIVLPTERDSTSGSPEGAPVGRLPGLVGSAVRAGDVGGDVTRERVPAGAAIERKILRAAGVADTVLARAVAAAAGGGQPELRLADG